jgi:hypothetical protein
MKISLLACAVFLLSGVFGLGYAGEVMDFEADVIEGEKKAPDLFLQMDTDAADMSAVLYDRANFNDFHRTDRQYRPRLNAFQKGVRTNPPKGGKR